ncbi:hypothetical protein TTHERM_000418279 (macronuclear) [Tetrahymena thermophila SB210]|uniref:Uncharacterized protein n=1 Tax=Tetrahymena thermophila (strain SB210) TaxID=312017 RepID=W7XLM9_TETTS|nr:hypothetical protein TTHERM_000418279 [Tetrahymena thermophila SB210]EWS76569.1 hypothetical protein TTHERM_000418279 [Tetrahymena thermophila SB210]|eukprot:XP_012650855.1 hypothetical protein TTHERM_000418279 [Tetrahymena thermophila SB210]
MQAKYDIYFAVGHTKVKTPDPIRTPKLSALRLGQYQGGGPLGKSQCRQPLFFCTQNDYILKYQFYSQLKMVYNLELIKAMKYEKQILRQDDKEENMTIEKVLNEIKNYDFQKNQRLCVKIQIKADKEFVFKLIEQMEEIFLE